MSFLHPALIAGLGLAVLPVVLHFLMKQKPKRLIFPALQLIQSRQKRTSRRFRLKHLWLLLLRVFVVGMLAIALSRPSLPPANYSFTFWEWGLLTVVILGGVTVYTSLLRRWNNQGIHRTDWIDRRSRARVWITTVVIGLLLLFVGWPYQRRVRAEIKDPQPMADLQLPVSAVWLFDTSQSTAYTQAGQTRLDVAKNLAKNHLGDLPAGSRVAIADNSGDHPIVFQSTLSTAQTRIEALEHRAVALPLNERLRAALQAQGDDRRRTLEEQGSIAEDVRKDRYLRRVYVLTDLAKSGWSPGISQPLKAELERQKDVDIYLIDVGEVQPQNVGVSRITLSRERISAGGSLDVQATVASAGIEEEVTLKLSILDLQEQLIPRGEARAKLKPSQSISVDFPRLKGLTGPVIHGRVIVDRGDPLAADNNRYFTVYSGPATPVLIVTPQIDRAFQIQVALAPFTKDDVDSNVFVPTVVTPTKLTDALIQGAKVIWLQDVGSLPDTLWASISRHVEAGNGLIVSLGDDRINPVDYDRTAAQVCLPAALDVWKPKFNYRMRFPNRTHPLFAEYRENLQHWAVLENDIAIYRFWKVKPAGGARVLATYDDAEQSPAILERSHGKGRVLMFTSGTHLPEKSTNRWNNFPGTLGPLGYWIGFVQQLADYTAGGGVEQFNHTCGEEVTLSLQPHAAERQMLFREPGFRQSPKVIPPDADHLTITRTEVAGPYTLIEGLDNARPLTGFSANLHSEECNLTRLTTDEINEMLGPARYQLARSIEELKSHIRSSEIGQEVFPILLVVLIVFFCGEHLVANRFYEEE